MKYTILFASPRPTGNTAALLTPFLAECGALGVEWARFNLYEQSIAPCRGCRGCQKDFSGFACVCRDDMYPIFDALRESELILLATPIYSWYCTAPMKAAMDRLIYGACKFYGAEQGPALLEGKRVASIVTCGYPPQRGADLWEEGLRRWCKHARMEYLGLFARRHMGYQTPFMDGEKEEAVRDFARALHLTLTEETG